MTDRERLTLAREIAHERGHEIERLRAKIEEQADELLSQNETIRLFTNEILHRLTAV